MAPSDTAPKFTFINSTKGSRTHSAAARTVIRQHAMRDIGAARRRSNTYGKRNLRQLPVFVDATAQPAVSELPAGDGVTRLPLRTNPGNHKTDSTPSNSGTFPDEGVTIEISEPLEPVKHWPPQISLEYQSPVRGPLT